MDVENALKTYYKYNIFHIVILQWLVNIFPQKLSFASYIWSYIMSLILKALKKGPIMVKKSWYVKKEIINVQTGNFKVHWMDYRCGEKLKLSSRAKNLARECERQCKFRKPAASSNENKPLQVAVLLSSRLFGRFLFWNSATK